MNKERIKKHWCIFLALLLICCIAVQLIIHIPTHINKTANIPLESITTTVEKSTDTLSIPGYEMLELIAERKEQRLCLTNPEQNMCYFQISLYLEDGTLLWNSELIEPGKTSNPMVLTKALSKGTYPHAVLRYSCYQMNKELSPLNGAETKVTLCVK